MDTNAINLAEVKHLIAMSDDEAWGHIIEALIPYGDSIEMYYEPGKYLVVLPTEECFPVLLHCNVHSGRGGDCEPVIFEDTALTHIASSNGEMGSENRAAVYVLLQAAKSLSLLPVMLFTSAEYDASIEMFLASEYFSDILEDIRAVISVSSVSTLGTMTTMYPMPEEFLERFRESGYKLVDPPMPYSIGEYTKRARTAHVILSVGTHPATSYDERLYLAGMHQCLNTVVEVVPTIDVPYLSLVDDTLPDPSEFQGRGTAVFTAAPVTLALKKPKCLVCGKTRQGRFHHRAQDFVCLVCERKVKKASGNSWNLFDLYQVRKDLEYERMVTRAANWHNKCDVKSTMCPSCGSSKVFGVRKKHNEFNCLDCGIVHWVIGDITIFVRGSSVYHMQTGTQKVLSIHPIEADASVKKCSVCGTIGVESFPLAAKQRGEVSVCEKCFNELLQEEEGGK